MREIRLSGSEGGGTPFSLPLSGKLGLGWGGGRGGDGCGRDAAVMVSEGLGFGGGRGSVR
jgi:hypothetical protein